MNQTNFLGVESISPLLEMGAYEALWTRKGTTFKRLAEMFREDQRLPSELVPADQAQDMASRVMDIMKGAPVPRFGVRVHRDVEYPEKLRDARYPVELLYYQGWWSLAHAPGVAVVGTRSPSPEGVRRARKLVRNLHEDGWAIISGLAKGIDTAAHEEAIAIGGQTIGVLGTPLSEAYPKLNRDLQTRIAKEYLVISQVPFVFSSQRDYRQNRSFFPERNLTMSALSDATIIVEASDTSGTLRQAKGALDQDRKLFILDSCFRNPEVTWPEKFEKKGAIRVATYKDIQGVLGVAVRD